MGAKESPTRYGALRRRRPTLPRMASRDPANKARALEILIAATAGTTADAEEAYDYFAGTDVWQQTCINQPGLSSTL